jgi:hypothetical protein
MMPAEVQREANQLLLDEFSATLDCSNEKASIETPKTHTEQDIPSLFASVQVEDANMFNSMKALVEIMPKVTVSG